MKFSIVTISFNQAVFLEKAIRSVINQNYTDLEYIIVDPGSTDGSRDIIERYRDKISKIIYEPDNGPADGLNKGFEHAQGDVFGFINADDALLPGALQKVSDFFSRNPSVDVMCGSGYISDSNDRVIKKMRPTPFSAKMYVYGAVTFLQQSTFFRSSAYFGIGGFNAENRTCWDGELLLDMALKGYRFRSSNESIALFRIHADSISGSGRDNERYIQDCDRLFSKVTHRKTNAYDRALRILYRINKWITNPGNYMNRMFGRI